MKAWADRHPNLMCLWWCVVWAAVIECNPADAWSVWWFAYIILLGTYPMQRAGHWYKRTAAKP